MYLGDAVGAGAGLIVMIVTIVALYFHQGIRWRRWTHLAFRVLIFVSGGAFVAFWIRDALLQRSIGDFLQDYSLRFLTSKQVFWFFLFPCVKLVLILKLPASEKRKELLASAVDFALAGMILLMPFTVLIVSVFFSEG